MAPVRPARPLRCDRPRILATIEAQTPSLHGIDLVRLDASRGSLQEICRLRARCTQPALLDLPGPGDPTRTSLLTTSEFLIFAAAEGFPWVGLRGVTGEEELLRARELLAPTTRIACTPGALEEMDDPTLSQLAAAADAVVVPYGEMVRRIGPEMTRRHVERAMVLAAGRKRPLLLQGGLLDTMIDSVMPELSQLEELSEFAADGCAGFVLTEETTRSPHPQLCVDTLEMVLAPWKDFPRQERGTARLGGPPLVPSGPVLIPGE